VLFNGYFVPLQPDRNFAHRQMASWMCSQLRLPVMQELKARRAGFLQFPTILNLMDEEQVGDYDERGPDQWQSL
jgi:hypothetical protein